MQARTTGMVSRQHPYYPEKDTCIWLKLARQGGSKARLKRFFNGEEIECKNQCNVCDIFNSTNKPMVDKTEIEFSRKKYDSYDDKLRKKGEFSEETGGFNVFSNSHQFSDVKGKNSKLTGGDAERFVGKELIIYGKQVEFLPENGKGVPDIRFDG